jgi:hypothetical protein
MIKASQNKQIKTDEVLQKFFFPDFGVTIEATSQEEAEAKLVELNNNKQ